MPKIGIEMARMSKSSRYIRDRSVWSLDHIQTYGVDCRCGVAKFVSNQISTREATVLFVKI